MTQAVFNGEVIADSEKTVVVEGNHYFPPDSIKAAFFTERDAYHTTCPWKGIASYYDVEVNGERADAVAWTYKDPSPAAANIKDHIAFYPRVEIKGAQRRLFGRQR